MSSPWIRLLSLSHWTPCLSPLDPPSVHWIRPDSGSDLRRRVAVERDFLSLSSINLRLRSVLAQTGRRAPLKPETSHCYKSLFVSVETLRSIIRLFDVDAQRPPSRFLLRSAKHEARTEKFTKLTRATAMTLNRLREPKPWR